MYANVQSFLSKKKEIEEYIADKKFDILLFTEVWLTEEHSTAEYLLPGFQSPTVDFKARGGTMIFVRENVLFYEVFPPEKCSESSWIVIQTENGTKRLYGCVYRSPNSSQENNEKLLENISWASCNFSEMIVMGDFNFPSIDWDLEHSLNAQEQSFLERVSETGLNQMVHEPTRFRGGQRPSLLDLLLVSDENLIRNTEIMAPFGKSDHATIETSIRNKHTGNERNERQYDLKRMDMNEFGIRMNGIDWQSIFDSGDVDYIYEEIANKTNFIVNELAPLRPKTEYLKAPWSNRNIRRLSKRKRKLWDKYKITKTDYDFINYRNALGEFNAEKDFAVHQYENNIIAKKKCNPKQYYKYVSKRERYKDNTISLLKDGRIESDPEKCANIMNDFFTSVFTDDSTSIITETPQSDFVSISDVQITESMVKEKIMALNIHKSVGPDGVSAYLLKSAAEIFAPLLTSLFLLSYETGRVPKMMKTANIVPIFKQGDKKSPNNYRPVSIIAVSAKIFESIIKESIENHVQINRIMANEQHGFRPGKSTSTNLIDFWNKLTDAAESKCSLSIIYTDLKKAFDSVPHKSLLYKLRTYGIGGRTIKWLENYFTERTQAVIISGKKSRRSIVTSGVPQGGVLSGILFDLYINDLPQQMKFSNISMYADDTKMFAQIPNSNAITDVQSDLNRMVDWCNKWGLSLNANKCFLVQYNPASTIRSFQPEYSIGTHTLVQKDSCKDLGVVISDDLKFHKQTSHACKRANSEYHRIKRSFVSRNPRFLSNMYKLYVRPHLEYCVELWNPMYQGDIDKIERVQNRMTRLLLDSRNRSPENRNNVLGITSHKQRRDRGDLISTYKHLEKNELFTLSQNDRTRGNDRKIHRPNYQSTIKRHSFAYRAVDHWNSLPNYVVNSGSLDKFKVNIDSYFLVS